ncbi:MAG: outer membrane beta-barrel protein, partial [Planctomycetota bacterium]
VAAGYDFDRNWSLELEYVYRSNDLDEASSGTTVLGTDGDLASASFMLNGFYRFDTDWAVDPYVGIGFGLAQEVDIDLRGGSGNADGSYSTESPAAQFMLGATREITDGIELFAEGRFFRAFDPELGRESGDANSGIRVETEYGHSALLFGAKFAL